MLDTELDARDGKIFIIASPSGVGKDSVVDTIKAMPEYENLRIGEPYSYTTRDHRPDDNERMPYIFVTDEQFASLIVSDMIEHAESFGHSYGLSRKSFEDVLCSGKNVLKIMNREGARDIQRMYPADTILIYLKPLSIKILEERLRGGCAVRKAGRSTIDV